MAGASGRAGAGISCSGCSASGSGTSRPEGFSAAGSGRAGSRPGPMPASASSSRSSSVRRGRSSSVSRGSGSSGWPAFLPAAAAPSARIAAMSMSSNRSFAAGSGAACGSGRRSGAGGSGRAASASAGAAGASGLACLPRRGFSARSPKRMRPLPFSSAAFCGAAGVCPGISSSRISPVRSPARGAGCSSIMCRSICTVSSSGSSSSSRISPVGSSGSGRGRPGTSTSSSGSPSSSGSSPPRPNSEASQPNSPRRAGRSCSSSGAGAVPPASALSGMTATVLVKKSRNFSSTSICVVVDAPAAGASGLAAGRPFFSSTMARISFSVSSPTGLLFGASVRFSPISLCPFRSISMALSGFSRAATGSRTG